MTETEVLCALIANQDSALRQLDRGDLTALRALAKEEAELFDTLRVIWRAP